ncbi:prolyl oligopeptidase family serine peptidase [Sungkyunkwania multivorans]|uniref:Prolyl oligopeptidase family serine peptidase n=1 Tax=Sungkyunkwania multivorans TaxID=1173618 RepID=A0ABW3CUP7_9FLAO
MRNTYGILVLSLLIQIACSDEKNQKMTFEPNNVTESFFGHSVQDPFRNIENLADSTVIRWLEKNTRSSTEKLEKISERNILLANITNNTQGSKAAVKRLYTAKQYYFYLKRLPKSKTYDLYRRRIGENAEELLWSPTFLKTTTKESSSYTITYLKPSWDASKIALAITKDDEEISEIVVFNVRTRTLEDLRISNCWPSELGGISWLPDNSGFTYTYIPNIDRRAKNYLLNTQSILHKLGEDPNDRKVIFAKEKSSKIDINEEDLAMIFIPDPNSPYLLAKAGGVGYSNYFYKRIADIENTARRWIPLFGKSQLIRQYVIDSTTFYYRTARDASNFKICVTNLDDPDFINPKVMVDESPDGVITDFAVTKDGLYYVRTKNGVDAKLFLLKDGQHIKIDLPTPAGSINISSANSDQFNLEVKIEGWLNYEDRYLYNWQEKIFVKENLAPVEDHPELSDVIVEEIEITSHDGALMPLSIIYNKDLKKNGKNPLLINAYGAYKWSNSPYLYPYLLHWVRNGGIYAVAHVRGGGEKGDSWYKAGYKETKYNSWKDLIAATEYLIDEKYTSKNKTALWGASAGGITVGRAITERPDLYAAAVIRVGVLNPLRSEFGLNGKNNVKEFGTVNDSTEFKALLRMDAYQSIKDGTKYPSVLLTAGMNDARVPPWQAAKFAARLEQANPNNDVMLMVDFDGGHGFQADIDKRNEELADIMTFLFWKTEHPKYQPSN